MLMGDERDGVGDDDLPDEQDFELVEWVHSKSGQTEYCIPFDNITLMRKIGNKITFYVASENVDYTCTDVSVNVNDIWQSWLVYCGAKSKPVAEF